MRLEPELWEALREICQREGRDVSQLVRQAEATRSGGRTSAVRVFLIEYFRVAANQGGHEAAHHGTIRPAMPGREHATGYPQRAA